MISVKLGSVLAITLLSIGAVLGACGDSGTDGDGDEGVPGHCYVETGGNCKCSASEEATVGFTSIATCDASGEKLCCAAPFEGNEEPYSLCSCYAGSSTCSSNLLQVDRCDGARYHESGSSGTSGCDQCQYDADCDSGCAASERGVCSKDSGCGSCYCE